MVKDIQDKIIRLKQSNDVCILAHSYMSEEICEIADFTGDSYALAVKAMSVSQKTVVMCGVRFMAETVKMLSPDKKVILSHPDAGCPMAEQFDRKYIEQIKDKYKGYAVVAYVNTTADIKAVSDVCVTSSSAVKICRAIPEKNILFIPDINLGRYVAEQIPEKHFEFIAGGCPVHSNIGVEEVLKAKAAHPSALLLVHPECNHEVTATADYAGSTSGIMEFAAKSENSEFIIGTENAIVQHLQFKFPDKKFYPLSKNLICADMKLTTLQDILNCIQGAGGQEIIMDEELRLSAVKCILKMIEYGG